jgi:hypothetical protein
MCEEATNRYVKEKKRRQEETSTKEQEKSNPSLV